MSDSKMFRLPWLYRVYYIWVMIFHRLYYRKYRVVGRENIPKGVPVIFAPNHQNALMDALAVLFADKKPVSFLARADIFRKPLVAALLNFLKIMPVYRIRDGFENLALNEKVFDNTIKVLRSGLPICILPEGNHDGHKRLRALKKGLLRIAFQAEESAGFNLGLCIVPVGIDYSNYFHAGADLLVVIGNPIRVSEYKDVYHSNQALAHNQLLAVLAGEMRKLIIDIPEEHYETIHQSSEMFEPHIWNNGTISRAPYNKLIIKQFIVEKMREGVQANPEALISLEKSLTDYNASLARLKLRDWLIRKNPASLISITAQWLLQLFLLPVHVYGTVMNYLPYKAPLFNDKNIRDEMFFSSFHFAIALFLFPVYYLLVFTICWLITRNGLITLLFALSLPVTGVFAFYNYLHMIKLAGQTRLMLLRIKHRQVYGHLLSLRKQIIDQIRLLTNR